MSDAPVFPVERTPLGLPAGSIRALLALGIAGAFWINLCHPKLHHVPLHLHFLAFAVLLFFASHGRSLGRPAERSPLHLPRGTFRFLLIAGTIGIIVWQYLQDPQEILKRMRPLDAELDYWTSLFAGTVGGFFLGWLLGCGPWKNSPVYQDLIAWVALIALLLFLGESLWKVFIDPNVNIGQREIWETILVSVVSFYFGTRS